MAATRPLATAGGGDTARSGGASSGTSHSPKSHELVASPRRVLELRTPRSRNRALAASGTTDSLAALLNQYAGSSVGSFATADLLGSTGSLDTAGISSPVGKLSVKTSMDTAAMMALAGSPRSESVKAPSRTDSLDTAAMMALAGSPRSESAKAPSRSDSLDTAAMMALAGSPRSKSAKAPSRTDSLDTAAMMALAGSPRSKSAKAPSRSDSLDTAAMMALAASSGGPTPRQPGSVKSSPRRPRSITNTAALQEMSRGHTQPPSIPSLQIPHDEAADAAQAAALLAISAGSTPALTQRTSTTSSPSSAATSPTVRRHHEQQMSQQQASTSTIPRSDSFSTARLRMLAGTAPSISASAASLRDLVLRSRNVTQGLAKKQQQQQQHPLLIHTDSMAQLLASDDDSDDDDEPADDDDDDFLDTDSNSDGEGEVEEAVRELHETSSIDSLLARGPSPAQMLANDGVSEAGQLRRLYSELGMQRQASMRSVTSRCRQRRSSARSATSGKPSSPLATTTVPTVTTTTAAAISTGPARCASVKRLVTAAAGKHHEPMQRTASARSMKAAGRAPRRQGSVRSLQRAASVRSVRSARRPQPAKQTATTQSTDSGAYAQLRSSDGGRRVAMVNAATDAPIEPAVVAIHANLRRAAETVPSVRPITRSAGVQTSQRSAASPRRHRQRMRTASTSTSSLAQAAAGPVNEDVAVGHGQALDIMLEAGAQQPLAPLRRVRKGSKTWKLVRSTLMQVVRVAERNGAALLAARQAADEFLHRTVHVPATSAQVVSRSVPAVCASSGDHVASRTQPQLVIHEETGVVYRLAACASAVDVIDVADMAASPHQLRLPVPLAPQALHSIARVGSDSICALSLTGYAYTWHCLHASLDARAALPWLAGVPASRYPRGHSLVHALRVLEQDRREFFLVNTSWCDGMLHVLAPDSLAPLCTLPVPCPAGACHAADAAEYPLLMHPLPQQPGLVAYSHADKYHTALSCVHIARVDVRTSTLSILASVDTIASVLRLAVHPDNASLGVLTRADAADDASHPDLRVYSLLPDKLTSPLPCTAHVKDAGYSLAPVPGTHAVWACLRSQHGGTHVVLHDACVKAVALTPPQPQVPHRRIAPCQYAALSPRKSHHRTFMRVAAIDPDLPTGLAACGLALAGQCPAVLLATPSGESALVAVHRDHYIVQACDADDPPRPAVRQADERGAATWRRDLQSAVAAVHAARTELVSARARSQAIDADLTAHLMHLVASLGCDDDTAAADHVVQQAMNYKQAAQLDMLRVLQRSGLLQAGDAQPHVLKALLEDAMVQAHNLAATPRDTTTVKDASTRALDYASAAAADLPVSAAGLLDFARTHLYPARLLRGAVAATRATVAQGGLNVANTAARGLARFVSELRRGAVRQRIHQVRDSVAETRLRLLVHLLARIDFAQPPGGFSSPRLSYDPDAAWHQVDQSRTRSLREVLLERGHLGSERWLGVLTMWAWQLTALAAKHTQCQLSLETIGVAEDGSVLGLLRRVPGAASLRDVARILACMLFGSLPEPGQRDILASATPRAQANQAAVTAASHVGDRGELLLPRAACTALVLETPSLPSVYPASGGLRGRRAECQLRLTLFLRFLVLCHSADDLTPLEITAVRLLQQHALFRDIDVSGMQPCASEFMHTSQMPQSIARLYAPLRSPLQPQGDVMSLVGVEAVVAYEARWMQAIGLFEDALLNRTASTSQALANPPAHHMLRVRSRLALPADALPDDLDPGGGGVGGDDDDGGGDGGGDASAVIPPLSDAEVLLLGQEPNRLARELMRQQALHTLTVACLRGAAVMDQHILGAGGKTSNSLMSQTMLSCLRKLVAALRGRVSPIAPYAADVLHALLQLFFGQVHLCYNHADGDVLDDAGTAGDGTVSDDAQAGDNTDQPGLLAQLSDGDWSGDSFWSPEQYIVVRRVLAAIRDNAAREWPVLHAQLQRHPAYWRHLLDVGDNLATLISQHSEGGAHRRQRRSAAVFLTGLLIHHKENDDVMALLLDARLSQNLVTLLDDPDESIRCEALLAFQQLALLLGTHRSRSIHAELAAALSSCFRHRVFLDAMRRRIVSDAESSENVAHALRVVLIVLRSCDAPSVRMLARCSVLAAVAQLLRRHSGPWTKAQAAGGCVDALPAAVTKQMHLIRRIFACIAQHAFPPALTALHRTPRLPAVLASCFALRLPHPVSMQQVHTATAWVSGRLDSSIAGTGTGRIPGLGIGRDLVRRREQFQRLADTLWTVCDNQGFVSALAHQPRAAGRGESVVQGQVELASVDPTAATRMFRVAGQLIFILWRQADAVAHTGEHRADHALLDANISLLHRLLDALALGIRSALRQVMLQPATGVADVLLALFAQPFLHQPGSQHPLLPIQRHVYSLILLLLQEDSQLLTRTDIQLTAQICSIIQQQYSVLRRCQRQRTLGMHVSKTYHVDRAWRLAVWRTLMASIAESAVLRDLRRTHWASVLSTELVSDTTVLDDHHSAVCGDTVKFIDTRVIADEARLMLADVPPHSEFAEDLRRHGHVL